MVQLHGLHYISDADIPLERIPFPLPFPLFFSQVFGFSGDGLEIFSSRIRRAESDEEETRHFCRSYILLLAV